MNRKFETLLRAECAGHRSLAVGHRAGQMRGQHCASDRRNGRRRDTAARNATRNEDGQIDDRGSDLEMLHSCLQRSMPKKRLSELSLRALTFLIKTRAFSAATRQISPRIPLSGWVNPFNRNVSFGRIYKLSVVGDVNPPVPAAIAQKSMALYLVSSAASY